MTQFDYGTINPEETDGVELSGMLNQYRDALLTEHAGTFRPDYIKVGMAWMDTSGATWLHKRWDGTNDIVIGTYDPTTHKYIPRLSDWEAEQVVASAATTDILSVGTARVSITGTVTITSFGTKANTVKLVRFASALVVQNTANIVTNDGQDINVKAGDTMIVASDNAGVARIWGSPTSGVTPGTITIHADGTAPSGSLKCNGALVSRTAYAALFAKIGTTYGAGDGSTTFTLPDLRGEFVRGWDDGRGVDSGRALGSAQSSQNLAHSHGGGTGASGGWGLSVSAYTSTENSLETQAGSIIYAQSKSKSVTTVATGTVPVHNHTIPSDGGTEARPRNVAMMFCIKY
ncbi:tail collar domain-containing protein [Rhizobium phage RHph_I4]|nr:tail collar domain-containing protein [Rhizobium phage RHph_I4]